MLKYGMSNKPNPAKSGAFLLGRSVFARISEVEGIRFGAHVEHVFDHCEREGLSADERRRLLIGRLLPQK